MKFLSPLAKQISSALFWMSPKGTLCHVMAVGTEKEKLTFYSNVKTQCHRNNPHD